MADFYEEWWNGKQPPEFVAAFIARHAKQPPWGEIIAAGISLPPASSSIVNELDINAARVALLILRGGLAKNGETRSDAYLISPPDSAYTPGDAARWLAAAPKPVACRASVRDGFMAIRCVPIDDPEFRLAHRRFADRRKSARVGEPRRAEKAGQELIYCVGAGESLVVSREVIDRVFEDYEITPIGMNSDVPAFYLSTHPEAARAAYAEGAVAMMKCTFRPDEWAREESGHTIMVRNEAWRVEIALEHAPGLSKRCDQCGHSDASWRETDVRSSKWVERAVCERCATLIVEPMARRYAGALQARMEKRQLLGEIEALRQVLYSLHAEERDQRAEELKSAADLLERAWRVLPMPAFVKDALTRYRTTT
jgi:hypothetical protein